MIANFQQPLHLHIRRSRWLAAFILLTHCSAACIGLFLPAAPMWGKIILIILVAYSCRRYLYLHVLRTHTDAIHEAVLYRPDSWLLRTTAGSRFASLVDSSFVHPWLCVLNLRAQSGKIYSLILLPDSLGAETLSRLRMRIRFAKK